MNKKVILLGLIMILFSSFISADQTENINFSSGINSDTLSSEVSLVLKHNDSIDDSEYFIPFDYVVGNNTPNMRGSELGDMRNDVNIITEGCLSSSCLNLSGSNDNHLVYPDSDASDLIGGNMTIIAWVYVPNSPGHLFQVVSKLQGANDRYNIYIDSDGRIYSAIKISGANNYFRSGTGIYSLNNWFMVTLTYNTTSGDSAMYINETVIPLDNTGSVPQDGDLNILSIGCEAGGDDCFEGLIDDVRLYKRLLTTDEITEIYNNQMGKSLSGTHFSKNITSDSSAYNAMNVTAFISSDSQTAINASIFNSNTDTETEPQTFTNGQSTLTFENLVINNLDNLSVRIPFYTDNSSKTAVSFDINITLYTSTPASTANNDLVVNMTFDNASEPWKDYSIYSHNFSTTGSVINANRTECKWYGCAKFDGSVMYINGTNAQFGFNNSGYAVSFWIYYNVDPDDQGTIAGLWQVGTDSGNTLVANFENSNNNGVVHQLYNSSGYRWEINTNDEAGNGVWYHYMIVNNKTKINFYRDGTVVDTDTYTGNDIADVMGQIMWIGNQRFGDSPNGYIDEFLLWNRSDFTSSDVQDIYDSRREGTPPDLDLYLKYFKYSKADHINWSNSNNTLNVAETLKINITIRNEGINNSEQFNWTYDLNDGTNVCNGTSQLNAQSEFTTVCNWTLTLGTYIGEIKIDTTNQNNEDTKDNNNVTVNLFFHDRPNNVYNKSELNEILIPYSQNTSNVVAYDSWEWSLTFAGQGAFSDAYTCDDAEPYAAQGRMAALSCMLQNYSRTSTPCIKAWKHINGWSNRSITGCTDSQKVMGYMQAIQTFDIMFPNMTREEFEYLSEGYAEKCNKFSEIVDLQNDVTGLIEGENGKGFGVGMAGTCYGILGDHSDNPSLIFEDDQAYYGFDVVSRWVEREERYLRAYKNDSWSKYQEGIRYKYTSQYHLGDSLKMRARNNLYNTNDYYGNAICAMAQEWVMDSLDFNYEGQTLRGGRNGDQKLRLIQRGDSYSYVNFDESFHGMSIYIEFANLCDDPNIKKSLLFLKDLMNTNGDGARSQVDFYMYPLVFNQIGTKADDIVGIFPKFSYDNANDIFTLRSNFNYVNDTIIYIDGGEERGGGHSQAQGYYLYALGEPFLDYEQIPYNDDMRMDVVKNGISLRNITFNEEGAFGIFNNAAGEYGYNQYYGNQDNANISVYPEFRTFPKIYGGDMEGYIGTNDSKFGGVYNYRGYFNSSFIKEYYLKYDNVMIKRTVIDGNQQTSGVYHNFLNINNEFNNTLGTNNIHMQRSNKNLDINVTYSNESYSILGGKTGIRYCLAKTSCSGNDAGNGNYSRIYMYNQNPNWDFIISHQWYFNGESETIIGVGGDDKGVFQGSNVLLFDNNQDNRIVSGVFNATGWGLAYNNDINESGAFNTTEMRIDGWTLFNSSAPMSVFLNRNKQEDKIIMTANTFQDDDNDGYDTAQSIQVTINCSELTNDTAPFNVTKNDVLIPILSQYEQTVTFTVTTGQNSDEYKIFAFNESGDVPSTTSTISTTSSTSATTTTIISTNTTNLFNKDNCEQGLDTMAQIGKFMPLLIVSIVLVIIFGAYIFITKGGIGEFEIQESGKNITIIILLFAIALIALLFIINLIINAANSAC